jgi:MarR family transcriptional regulator, organic hydroperoxide resistance regulator
MARKSATKSTSARGQAPRHATPVGRASEPPKPQDDVLDFMQVMWSLDHALQSRSKRMETEIGVTGPQRLVIRAVGRARTVSAGEIAETIHVHPSTLTGVLRRLVERGLLTRAVDGGDKRRALFSLTASGERIDALKAGTVEAAVRRAMRRTSREQQVNARKVLAVVREELEREDA